MTKKQKEVLGKWKAEIAPKELILDPVTDTYLDETVTLEIIEHADGKVGVYATVMLTADSFVLMEATISKNGKLTARRIS